MHKQSDNLFISKIADTIEMTLHTFNHTLAWSVPEEIKETKLFKQRILSLFEGEQWSQPLFTIECEIVF